MNASTLHRKAAARALALVAPESAADDLVDSDLVDLSAEFPSGSTAAAVRQAAAHAVEQHLCDHYTRRPGIAPLCRAVAALLAADGLALTENDVVIAGSVDEARYVAARALTTVAATAGKPVYALTPPAGGATAGFAFAGATVVALDLDKPLPQAAGGLLYLANPNPATAQVLGPSLLAQVAEWAAAADLSVLADETGALVHPEYLRTRCAALPGMAQRTLTLGSFADAPGMAAWQVSWFAGPKAVLVPVRDLKQSITICTSAPSQYAALAAADAGHDVLAQYRERQESLTSLLERHHVPYWEPHTTAYVVADVAALGGGDAVAAACRQQGLRIASGSSFGAPERIRLATPTTALGDALERLDTALAELRK